MIIGEVELFKAVLRQAAQDAFLARSPTSGKAVLNRESALCFFQGGEDLSMICDFAGVEYGAIRRIVQKTDISPSQKYLKIKEVVR